MVFDFTTPLERKGTASLKWQRYEQQDVIPMWVADMDLASPPAVRQALAVAVQRGAFGYGEVAERLNQAFVDWCRVEYGWAVDSGWLVWIPGVVPGFNLAVDTWLQPQDGLLVQSPVYPPIRLLGHQRQRPLVEAPVTATDLADWLQPETRALVLCNPQNPTGRVYDRASLEQLAQLAEAHDLLVISDEIWADLILAPGLRHTPFAAVNETAARRSITLMAPSKTFNIAGLNCAVAVIPDAGLRSRYRAAMRGLMPDMNYLGLLAAEAAWTEGRAWRNSLVQHLNANLDRLEAWLQDFPMIGYTRPQATFVAWLDVRELGLGDPVQAFLNGGVALSPGAAFGDDRFVRLNFGCPAAQLDAALLRMAAVIRAGR